MMIATHAQDSAAAAPVQPALGSKIVGLTVTMVVPALFWVAVLAGAAGLCGVTFTASALAVTGTAIALFLGTVCAPVMLRA